MNKELLDRQSTQHSIKKAKAYLKKRSMRDVNAEANEMFGESNIDFKQQKKLRKRKSEGAFKA